MADMLLDLINLFKLLASYRLLQRHRRCKPLETLITRRVLKNFQAHFLKNFNCYSVQFMTIEMSVPLTTMCSATIL